MAHRGSIGISPQDAINAAEILGGERTRQIVGEGGLSGTTLPALQRLVREAAQAVKAIRRTPRCAACSKPVASNPECLRCMGHARNLANPFTAEERYSIAQEVVSQQAQRDAAHERRLAPLRGRLVQVALVGCGKTKADKLLPARDLYLGNLFRLSRQYAERCVDDWVILSGGHGMVDPEQLLEPYEISLTKMRLVEREAWAHRVSLKIKDRYQGINVEYVGLAGNEYLTHLVLNGPLTMPLSGLGIGSRMKWLRLAIATCPRISHAGHSLEPIKYAKPNPVSLLTHSNLTAFLRWARYSGRIELAKDLVSRVRPDLALDLAKALKDLSKD